MNKGKLDTVKGGAKKKNKKKEEEKRVIMHIAGPRETHHYPIFIRHSTPVGTVNILFLTRFSLCHMWNWSVGLAGWVM